MFYYLGLLYLIAGYIFCLWLLTNREVSRLIKEAKQPTPLVVIVIIILTMVWPYTIFRWWKFLRD